jgi:uncharacterized membrane protein required for colicin V production
VSLEPLAINLFDLLLVLILVGGIVHGRKRGMSGEVLGLLKWLSILLGGAAIYQPMGNLLAQSTGISVVTACLIVYLGAALVILLGFSVAESRLREKLVRADIFGRNEYQLGMAAGMLRFCCILLVVLALLNARSFSAEEIKASQAYQDAAYGSQIFPTLQGVQVTVFEKSLAGRSIKQGLGFLLINPKEAEPLPSKAKK